MPIYLTTTGLQSPVVLDDLGARTFTHPTVNYDLLVEFTAEEVAASSSIQNAVDNEYITITDENGSEIKSIPVLIIDQFVDSTEPNGFINTTDSSIAFDDGTRAFTIQPTGSSFSYYTSGQKRNIDYTDTLIISDIEGSHFLYYEDYTLKEEASLSFSTYLQNAIVSIIYWDADNKKALYFAEERHGPKMDGADQFLWHTAIGTVYHFGLAPISMVVDGDGSLDAHAQLGLTRGQIIDEDIIHTLSARVSTANWPVFYRSGSGVWRRIDPQTAFPLTTTGTGRMAWNQFTGGNWQLTEGGEGKFILIHVFGTNDPNQPFIAVVGQVEYADVASARTGANTEISSLILTGLPFEEFLAIASIISETSSAYTNAVKTRFVSTGTGEDFVDWRVSRANPVEGSVQDHGNLSGLADPDHPFTATYITKGNAGVITCTDLACLFNADWCSTTVNGFAITDNGDGTVGVAAGEAMLRVGATESSELKVYAVPAAASIALTEATPGNVINYVYIDENSGNPIITNSTTPVNGFSEIFIYIIVRNGNTLYIRDFRNQAVDMQHNYYEKSVTTKGYEHVKTGTKTTETGTRNLSVTAGFFFYGSRRISHPSFDTSGADTFTYVYQNGAGGWNRVSSQTQIDNQNYDNSGVLTAVGAGNYGVHWGFLVFDTTPFLSVLYGQAVYSNLSDAQIAKLPTTLPPEFDNVSVGTLIFKIIVQYNGVSFTDIQSPFDPYLSVSTSPFGGHNTLTGIQGGALNDYYHFTNAQHTDLTDTGDTALHYHATDRARANHTGTQLKNTISDFTHNLAGVEHSADTLANLNAKVSDATLDDSSASRTPTAHGLAGALHSADTLANLNAKISDATLDDSSASRTPTAHAMGGAAHSADTLANLNAKISDATLDDSSDTRTPTVHGSSHRKGGSDAVRLDDFDDPQDNTDLNATISAHGLCPKGDNNSEHFLAGNLTWRSTNKRQLVLVPASNLDYTGDWVTATVDTNTAGVGAPLSIASDGNFDMADANVDAFMPCIALALATGTGSKPVLLSGTIRNDTWSWTPGGIIYVSTTAGQLTQTNPTTTGDYSQRVGWATASNAIYFDPASWTEIKIN